MLRLGLVLAVLLEVFPHAVATAGFFQSSFALSACYGYGFPFLSPSAFQSVATLAAHSGLHPRLPLPVPPTAPLI